MKATVTMVILMVGASSVRAEMHIVDMEPRIPVPGNRVIIYGRGFDPARQHAVYLYRVVDRSPIYYRLPTELWQDEGIVARVPRDLPPDHYGLYVGTPERRRLSNTVMFVIPGSASGPGRGYDGPTERRSVPARAPSPAGMMLEHVSPDSVAVGGRLTITGRHFGDRPGDRRVILSPGVGTLTVEHWRDDRIVVRLPAGVRPGDYRVRVNYDTSGTRSSNTLAVRVR